jgi:hypothetical protein
MTLKPTDMLEIQSAIDQYERKFPRRPAPSAVAALAWRLGKKGFPWRQTAHHDAQPSVADVGSGAGEKPDSVFAEQEYSLVAPWIENALMLGWWGAVAAMVATVFFFGAMVGGFK